MTDPFPPNPTAAAAASTEQPPAATPETEQATTMAPQIQAAEQRAQQAIQEAQQERAIAQRERAAAQEAQQAAAAAQDAAEQALQGSQPTPKGSPPAVPGQASMPTKREAFSTWPRKGDLRPQPWDLDALEISPEMAKLAPGARDTVSPVVIHHSYPILSLGSQGSTVADLAGRLHLLGYDTDITRGENMFNTLTESVMGAVDQFREDYNVQEDPTPYGGRTAKAAERAAAIVGPYTWEAILRASERELAAI
jgi:hypothetical protein